MRQWGGLMLAALVAQTPAPQVQFRGTTDIVLVDARVVDKNGAPVTGLSADDFDLRVDGKPRRIVSIEYHAAPSVLRDGGRAGSPTGPGDSSVLMAVDLNNMRPGSSRATLDAAAAFVERLPAGVNVGLTALPNGRPGVSFLEGRAAVASTLRGMSGRYNSRIPIGQDVLEARIALHQIIGQMSALDGRRTVVYLADRLADDISTTDIARRAALSGVAFFVVAADAPVITSDVMQSSDSPGDEYTGLAALATASGGVFLRHWAGVANTFDRIQRELAGEYLLTFATDPSGADNGRHRISVKVKRAGVEVHARMEFVK